MLMQYKHAGPPVLSAHSLRLISVSLLALSTALTNTACGALETASRSVGSTSARNNQLTEFDEGIIKACISRECELGIAPRLLSAGELATIESELSPDETVVDDQSFFVTLPVKGMATLVTTEKDAGQFLLSLRMGHNEYASVYQSYGQHPGKVQTLAFEDVHQDGGGPDIVVIARYDPENGDAPSTTAHILFNRGDDTFQSDIAVDRILSERNITTVGKAIEVVQAEGLVRGLQYREGPP